MAVSIEDILMARAQQEEEQRMDPATSMILGAGLGGTAGVTVGGMGRRLNADGSIQGKTGRRMAGGLVGLILGGGLGPVARESMVSESPAGRMLAKLQTQGTLSHKDASALQDILADTYSNTLGM